MYKLKYIAKVLTSISPNFMDIANATAIMIPILLEATLGFYKLVLSILPLMAKKNQFFGILASMENKLKQV